MSKSCEDIISVVSVCSMRKTRWRGAVFIIERRTNYDELLPMSSFDYTSMNLSRMNIDDAFFSSRPCLPADLDQRAMKRAVRPVEKTVRLA